MSERVDRKLGEVAVATYTWRHEAEFAAGFLLSAGIPHRLQIDDPALGLSVSGAATIWVLGMDEPRARQTLEIDGHLPRLTTPGRSPNHPAPRARMAASRSQPLPSRAPGVRILGDTSFSVRERLLSTGAGLGLATVGKTFFESTGVSIATLSFGIFAATLLLVGISGRGPHILRRLLGALSGNAPR